MINLQKASVLETTISRHLSSLESKHIRRNNKSLQKSKPPFFSITSSFSFS